jgi:hypothetical protein
LTGIETDKIKLKMIEETQSRRIDRLVYDKETMTLPAEQWVENTLKDAKVYHKSTFLLELKDTQDLEEDATIIQAKATGASKQHDVELLDDSEQFRTVIVNHESEKGEFNRF